MEAEELEVGKQVQTIVDPVSGKQVTKFVCHLDEQDPLVRVTYSSLINREDYTG
jgi:hypothetical protein